MRYDPKEYSLAAEFVKQFAQEDKSGQMAKIAEMLRYAANMALSVQAVRSFLSILDDTQAAKGAE